MFKLDIDRLHKVFHGELTGRDCGITTAVCYQAIGYAQIENKNVFIIYEGNHNLQTYIIRQLIEILNYEQIQYVLKDNEFQFIFESKCNESASLFQRYLMSKITICSKEKYDSKYNYGRNTEYDILLYDFTEGYFQGFNSVQSTWDDIVKAEEILWSIHSGMRVTHF